MDGKIKRLVTNLLSVGAIQILNYAFPLLTLPIITRIIGPDKFGSINFASSVVGYFTLFISYSFGLTAVKELSANSFNIEARNQIFSDVFYTRIFLLALSTLLFVYGLSTIDNLKSIERILICTFYTCISVAVSQEWLFQAMQDLSKIAILNLISKVIFSALVLYFINDPEDSYWYALALSIANITMSLITFGWALRRYKLKFVRIDLNRIFFLIWNEKVFFLSICIITFYVNINIIVLGVFRTDLEVGYYSAGIKLISIVQVLIALGLTQAVFPFISRAFADSIDIGLQYVRRIMPFVVWFGFVGGCVIFFGADLFINFFYGSDFFPAILVCKILAFLPLIIAVSHIAGTHVALNLKMQKVFLIINIIGALVCVILNLFFVKKIGYVGSAISWLLTEFLILVMFYIFLKRKNIIFIHLKYFKLKALAIDLRKVFG